MAQARNSRPFNEKSGRNKAKARFAAVFHTEAFHTETFHTEAFHTEVFHTEAFHTEAFPIAGHISFGESYSVPSSSYRYAISRLISEKSITSSPPQMATGILSSKP